MISAKIKNKIKKSVAEIEAIYYKAQIARLELDEKLSEVAGDTWYDNECFCTFSASDGLVICCKDKDNNEPGNYTIDEFLEKIGVELDLAERQNMLDFGENTQ